MATFSQLVDEMIQVTKRSDLVSEIPAYVNQTLREMHSDPDSKSAVLFGANRKEDRLVVDTDSVYLWPIPNEAAWQMIETVQYEAITDNNGFGIYPPIRSPGRALRGLSEYVYRTGDSFAIVGAGGIGAIVNVSWFEFVPRLKYFAVDARPATWDDATGWSYAAGITTTEQRAAARAQTSNWILMRWGDTVREGVKAKIYKRINDERQKTSYSLYTQLCKIFMTSESGMTQGFQSIDD